MKPILLFLFAFLMSGSLVQGALMQARVLRSVTPFDVSVDELRSLLQWD